MQVIQKIESFAFVGVAFPVELWEQHAECAENAANSAIAEVVFVSAAADCHKGNDAVAVVDAVENGRVLSHLQH